MPAARPARAAASTRTARGEIAAGPTLGLGVAIALVGIVTLVIALMPLPRGGSLRISRPSGGASFTQPDSTDETNVMQIICPNGCPAQTTR